MGILDCLRRQTSLADKGFSMQMNLFPSFNPARPVSEATRRMAAVLALAATACLPYPVGSPRVEPGVTFGGGMGLHGFLLDTTGRSGSRPRAALLPELTFSPSLGFARADGSGPAFRAGGTIGFPGPWEGDVYAQFPRVGPLITGVGALSTPLSTSDSTRFSSASPYAMIGWERQDGTMLYGSFGVLPIHRQTRPESIVTTRVIVIGFQRRQVGNEGQSASRRAFLALFYGNRNVERVSVFGAPASLRTLFVVGLSFDVARPWSWFSEPNRLPARRPGR